MKNFLPLSLALLLGACALLPDMGPRPALKSDPSLGFLPADAGAQWPAANWWEDYHDAQLDALMGEGLRDAPDLALAAARAGRASAVADQSRATLWPTLGAEGAVQKVKQSYNNGIPAAFVPQGFQETASATLNAGWDIDLWGRNRALLAAATSEAEAAGLDAAQARLMLTTAIAGNYATLAQLYNERDTAEAAVKVRGTTANLFNQRLQNGLENKGSYDQVLVEQATAEAEIAALDESIQLQKNAIAALVGAGPDRAATIQRPALQLVARGIPADLPLNWLGRRPDIQAARRRVEAAGTQIDVAETAFYPNVNLSGYIGHQSLGLDNFTDHGSLIGAFGPAVSLPLFEGGRLRGAYRQARADYDAGVAQYNSTLAQALREVGDAAASQRALALRTQKTEAAQAAAERAYNVVHDRYRGGLATYLDVLRSEDALIASRRAVADIHARAFTLDVAMVRALGGGFTPDQTRQD